MQVIVEDQVAALLQVEALRARIRGNQCVERAGIEARDQRFSLGSVKLAHIAFRRAAPCAQHLAQARRRLQPQRENQRRLVADLAQDIQQELLFRAAHAGCPLRESQ